MDSFSLNETSGAKVQRHAGELFPHIGFDVTNLPCRAELRCGLSNAMPSGKNLATSPLDRLRAQPPADPMPITRRRTGARSPGELNALS